MTPTWLIRRRAEADTRVLWALEHQDRSIRQLRGATGLRKGRLIRALDRLLVRKRVHSRIELLSNGRGLPVFGLNRKESR